MSVGNPLAAALSDPWGALRLVLDGPLHPGGEAATCGLLDRAEVGPATRLVDVGCGAGEAVRLARERGADAVGVDAAPSDGAPSDTTVRGALERLPLRPGRVDVLLAECVVCLAEDLDGALRDAHDALRPGGRLALSDVVVDGDIPDLPPTLAEPLCLTGDRRRDRLFGAVETAGFEFQDHRDHQEDLLALRDEVQATVDYERLLPLLGEEGDRLLDGIETLETAAEDGRVGYVSLVATASG